MMKSDNTGASKERLGLKELVAMGVGGMVGGGIFSVLGLSVQLSGHAAPIAFLLGGIIAMLTGLSYAKLGLKFRSDGGSFTYLEHAFSNKNVAGIGGWLLLVGYVGTMALYSFTFGVYGTAMLGEEAKAITMRHFLQSFILLLFMFVNLYGVKAAGKSEDVIVMIKVLILGLFACIGLFYMDPSRFQPLFNKGAAGVIMGAAVIFVAYEGFELIPNAVHEMKEPERELSRSIVISILITITIYMTVSLVAVGNLGETEINRYREYALAVAAKPFLGKAGFLLIGLGALLSTASAINATMFGTARLGMVMAVEKELPKVFSHKERTRDIPWVSLLFITFATLLFVNIANLTIISSFCSATFLLIFAAINISALRLKDKIGIHIAVPLLGVVTSLGSWLGLVLHMWQHSKESLVSTGIFYFIVATAELLFSKRRLVARPNV